MIARFAPIGVALVLVVGLVAWYVVAAAREPEQLRVGLAENATVELPDGREVDAYAGLALPDGAVVETGPTGTLQADETIIGPDRRATVEDGELEPE